MHHANDLEQYLHQHIPLSLAMQVAVLDVSPRQVTLQAPLEPNVNHRGTVFGGSASAVAMLAAWSLLHVGLRQAGVDSHLVIQSNSMHFERPITGLFTARSSLAQPDAWEPFVRMIGRKGRARIGAAVVLHSAGEVVGRLEGEFVALGAGA